MNYTDKRNLFEITCFNDEIDGKETLPFFSDDNLPPEYVEKFNFIFVKDNYHLIKNLIENYIVGNQIDNIDEIILTPKKKL